MRHVTRLTMVLTAGLIAGCGPEWTDEGTNKALTSSLPTKPTMTLVATGPGWRQLAISGTVLDLETNTKKTVSNEEVYVITGSGGIATAPVAQVVRDDLSADLNDKLASGELKSAEQAVYFLSKNTAIAVAKGTLAKSAPKGTLKWSCGDYYKNYDKTLSFDQEVSSTNTLNSVFDGTLALSGNIKGLATGSLRLKIHRAWCVPYWASLVHVKANGNLQAQGRVTAQGSFAGKWSWSKQVAKLPITEFTIWVGLPVTVGFNLPVDLGIDASAQLTANLDGNVSAGGSFDVTCTTAGCTSNTSFTHSFNALSSPTFSASARVKVTPWIQGALRAYLYDDGTIYGQIGVRPALEGDLWAYSGNSCGDANNDGVNETVSALTLDADLRLDVTTRIFVNVPLLSNIDKPDHWTLGRWHVGFWGSGSALNPIFYRKYPTKIEVYDPDLSCSGLIFQGRMRPCWPYTHKIDYHLDWKDGTSTDVTLSPYTLFTACKSFTGFPPGVVTLTAIKDAHGRTLNRTTSAGTGYPVKPTLPDQPLPAAP